MSSFYKFGFLFFIILTLLFGCKKDDVVPTPASPENTSGKIKLQFSHTVGAEALVLNSNQYTNEAGNKYEIDELMYFISDLIIHTHAHSSTLIDDWTAIHYIDVCHPESLVWDILDSIPQGAIDSITFTFGISAQRNQSFMFVNPPESNMAWPDILGGGYHYMMINGKWTDPQNNAQPYNFHLGIGQIYTDTVTFNTNTITGYVQNYFMVTLPTPNVTINPKSTTTIKLNMDISSWFKTPHTWDFDYWGGAVMQNQRAMQTIKENGVDVFSVR